MPDSANMFVKSLHMKLFLFLLYFSLAMKYVAEEGMVPNSVYVSNMLVLKTLTLKGLENFSGVWLFI